MSDCGEQLFRQYIQCCEQLVKNVKEKTLCAVLSVDDHILDDDAVQAVGTTQTSGEVEVSIGDNDEQQLEMNRVEDNQVMSAIVDNGDQSNSDHNYAVQTEALSLARSLHLSVNELINSMEGSCIHSPALDIKHVVTVTTNM